MGASLARLLRRLAKWLDSPSGSPVAGRPRVPTDADRVWAKALADALPAIAKDAREAASKWGTSAVGLLAVISITTIFKGRETLETLAEPWNLILMVIVVFALILTFVTLFAAASAAQGSARPEWESPNSFRRAQIAAADHATRWMNRSRRAAFGGFLASLLAVLVLWAGPKPPSTASDTLVIAPDGTRLCGKLEVADGRVQIDGQALPATPGLAVFTVEECPTDAQ